MIVSNYQLIGWLLIAIGGICSVMLIIGYFCGHYHISRKGIIDATIQFRFPLWAKILMLGYTPVLKDVTALVDYQYKGESSWTFQAHAIWHETGNFLTNVRGNVDRTLSTMRIENGQLMPLDKTEIRPLSSSFRIGIEIKDITDRTLTRLLI